MKAIKTLLIIVLLVSLAGLGMISIMPGSPFLPGNSPESARATAQHDLLQAQSTPQSDSVIIALDAFDNMTEQQRAALDTIGKIVISGDAAQTSIAWSGTCNSLLIVLFPVALGFLFWAIRRTGKKEGNDGNQI